MTKTMNWQERKLTLAVALIVTSPTLLPSMVQAQGAAGTVQIAPPQIDEIVEKLDTAFSKVLPPL